jgi:hypothetical protein
MVRLGEDLFYTLRADIYHSAIHCNKWTPKFGPEEDCLQSVACNPALKKVVLYGHNRH